MSSGSSLRRLILARHGESLTNAANIFTGLSDPPLTQIGEGEARGIARQIADAGLSIDRIFISALRRAAATAALITTQLGRREVAPVASAALNERDYGALTGLNKTEAARRFGREQIAHWRRSWADAPPEGESLRDTAARVLPYYLRHILPQAMRQRTVLVIAHGNSLRALCMALEGLSPEQVERLEIGTGSVRLYQLAADTTIRSATLLESGMAIPLPPLDDE